MQVAIITGGASGVGAALCRQMAKAGIQVVIADIDLSGAVRLRDEITASGRSASCVQLDVSNKTAIFDIVNSTARERGRLDFLFNNAGLLSHGPAHELDWEKILAVNLGGVIAGTLAAYAVMRKQGFGHIVNTSSMSALSYAPFHLPYVTSKSAVLGFSIALRSEAESYGVKVSAVCPGNIETPMTHGAKLSGLTPAISCDRAATEILKAVHRNSGVIVFPFYTRIFWWIERLAPWLGTMLRRRIVRNEQTRAGSLI